MPRVIQCLQDDWESSGLSLAHLTLRARQASQPTGERVNKARGNETRRWWLTLRLAPKTDKTSALA
jgi:hypothetical protein